MPSTLMAAASAREVARSLTAPGAPCGNLILPQKRPPFLRPETWAGSQGEVMGSGNAFAADDAKHDGMAYQITLTQPLPFFNSTVKAHYLDASPHFLNPFGGTVTPGSRRGEVTLEMKPRANTTLHFGFTSESNHTTNVDNNRLTFSAAWDQILNERIKFHLGFDHRAWRYPGGGIDREHSQASISMAPTSASATSSPATLASPRYHHMLLRRVFFVM